MKRAELFDGTTLEFPDETPDSVMDGVVRKETESRKKPEVPAILDPTEGMSGTEKFLAGVGGGMTGLARGLKQTVADAPFIGDEKRSAELKAETDERRRLDKPLMNTGAGMAGDITGKIALAFPTAFIPGANTYTGAALTGAALGALEPVGKEDSRLKNVGFGTAGGVGGQVLGRTVTAAARGTKALLEPFFEKGQEQIAARTINRFAGNAASAANKMSGSPVLVKGSIPTAAEASGDAGIAQLQRAVHNQSPQLAAEFTERALDQNAARLTAMRELTKYGADLDPAIGRRAAAGAKLYEKAFGQKMRVDDVVKTLSERPSFQQALDRAQRIASEEGAPLKNLFDQNGKFASTRGLHYVKMGFDDLINDAPKSNIGVAELRAIKNTRGELLDWMSEANPSYKTARARFEKMSRPINREEVAREISSRATRNQLPNVRGENTIYPDAFSRTLKDDGESVVKAATGRVGKGLEDVMTQKQMDVLKAVRGDLARTVAGRDLGRAVGSNTGQNLASQNLLRRVIGPTGLPESWAESTLLQTVARPYQFLAKSGEQGIQDTLGKAMLDPEYAAKLIRNALKGGRNMGELIPYLPTAAGITVANE